VVDEAPSSPNQKQATWAAIAPLIPMFKEQLASNPELLIALLEYSPMPMRLIELLKQLLAKAAQDPTTQQAKQLEIADKVATISMKQAQAEMNNAKAGSTQATAMYDFAMARNLLLKHGLDGPAAALEQMHKAAQIDTEQAKAENLRAKTRGDHAGADETHVGVLRDLLTPIQQPGPMAA